MKLSKRLQQIFDLATSMNIYDHIWDGCCDHGYLGMALLAAQARGETPTTIHFVDVVPEIIKHLEQQLTTNSNYDPSDWQTHCLDVTHLPLEQHSQAKHLVIIAGVGGDLTAELVTAILHRHQNTQGLEIDFLLCPVHRIYTLRQQLIRLDVGLIKECLIQENKRFYEILWISNDRNTLSTIDPIGSELWRSDTPEQRQVVKHYLEQNLSHYQRVQAGNDADASDIIARYATVYRSLS